MSSPSVNFSDVSSKAFQLTSYFFEYLRNVAGRNPFLTKSIILHIFLLVLFSGMIPSCTPPVKQKIIAVDIMPISNSPVKPLQQPQARPKPQKIVEPKPVPKIIPKPVKQEAIERKKAIEPLQPKKTDLPSIKKEDIKQKPEPKPDIVKKLEENKDKDDQAGKKSLLKDLEKKEESLDELFDKIEKEQPKEQPKPQPQTQNKAKTPAVEDVPDQSFVQDLMQKIQSQISLCWSIPIGAKEVQNMQASLLISLDPAGNVLQVKISDTHLYNSDNIYRVLADSAVRAVKECSPLRGLPADKYKFWQEIEFTFDPAVMVN